RSFRHEAAPAWPDKRLHEVGQMGQAMRNAASCADQTSGEAARKTTRPRTFSEKSARRMDHEDLTGRADPRGAVCRGFGGYRPRLVLWSGPLPQRRLLPARRLWLREAAVLHGDEDLP